MRKVTPKDFANSFGTTLRDIPEECMALIEEKDFRYTIIEGKERDNVILNVLKKIESDKQVIGGPDRKDTWQKGWNENLQEFIQSGYNLETLVPKFIRSNQPIRLNCKFIMPQNPMFELNYFIVFRRWLFKKYFDEFDSIYEFGGGTGLNLVELSKMYPEKKLYGLDFVPASIEIIKRIREVYGLNVSGHFFDMISPDDRFQLDDNSLAFTFGSLEQLAGKFEKFLQFLLEKSPRLCIHLEPIIELYDENNLIDYLAIKFHKKRGYTENYLPKLKELEAQGKIEIIKTKRLFLGSIYMEGFSYIIWKPKQEA